MNLNFQITGMLVGRRCSAVAAVAAQPRGPAGESRQVSRLPRRSGWPRRNKVNTGAKAGAFSLIELMVVIGLLSFIVLALMAVFNSTQTAFRASVTQTDVLEGGRITIDMMTTDLRQMTPSFGVNNGAVNFCVTNYPTYPLLVQSLVGISNPNIMRTNVLENFFILSRDNVNGSDSWVGTGYAVVTNQPNGLYSLYRFTAHYPMMAYGPQFVFTNAVTNGYAGLLQNGFAGFLQAPTNYSHLLDGVVHLRLLAYDTNGMLISTNWRSIRTNALYYGYDQGPALTRAQVFGWRFYSNALPASVDIELGMLEDRVLRRAESLPNTPAPNDPRDKYLQQQAGKVHLFRQHVTIPSVDLSAYQ